MYSNNDKYKDNFLITMKTTEILYNKVTLPSSMRNSILLFTLPPPCQEKP